MENKKYATYLRDIAGNQLYIQDLYNKINILIQETNDMKSDLENYIFNMFLDHFTVGETFKITSKGKEKHEINGANYKDGKKQNLNIYCPSDIDYFELKITKCVGDKFKIISNTPGVKFRYITISKYISSDKVIRPFIKNRKFISFVFNNNKSLKRKMKILEINKKENAKK